jgi:hypothetical protein
MLYRSNILNLIKNGNIKIDLTEMEGDHVD